MACIGNYYALKGGLQVKDFRISKASRTTPPSKFMNIDFEKVNPSVASVEGFQVQPAMLSPYIVA